MTTQKGMFSWRSFVDGNIFILRPETETKVHKTVRAEGERYYTSLEDAFEIIEMRIAGAHIDEIVAKTSFTDTTIYSILRGRKYGDETAFLRKNMPKTIRRKIY